MLKYLLIAIGGALGSIARYWVTTAVGLGMGVTFPYGTLTVNLAACFAIGFLISSASQRVSRVSMWRYLIAVGFIGAFSTFSTVEWETFSTAQAGAHFTALLYAGVSLICGLIAVTCGSLLAKTILLKRNAQTEIER